MMAIAGTAAHGGATTPATDRTVIVCMEGGAGLGIAQEARALASKIFVGIGVTIEWRRGLPGCPEHGIKISLNHETPRTMKPGVLAYSLPYEGTHIRLFYDRISEGRQPRVVPRLLAHVLVHEITHILQGVNRHSDTGIMKTEWNADDYRDMAWKHLEFELEDIDLINLGLAARAGTGDGCQ
jgi:hypothetical protein